METPTWLQIGSAVLIIGFLIYLWPAARHWAKNSPKMVKGDLAGVLIPFGGVVLFVILLMMSV